MATKPKMKDALTLELCRETLNNAGSYAGIAQALEKYGYDSKMLEQGRELLRETRLIYDRSKMQKILLRDLYHSYHSKLKSLSTSFCEHRRIARLLYRDKKKTMVRLAIQGPVPRDQGRLIETMRKFYTEATTVKQFRQDLERLKLGQDELKACLVMIREIEIIWAECLKVKGTSKLSTFKKNKALQEMRDWMSTFYGIAKIGLKDQPQLLDALRKNSKA